MQTSAELHATPFLLDQRYYVNPAANEIGFYNGTVLDPVLKVEPRLMEVLLSLARAKGGVVKKEQMVAEIWDNYGGGEEALLQSISKLRKIFRDDARRPKVIETIPKKGYRLLTGISEAAHLTAQQSGEKTRYSTPVIIQQVGIFTGFIERLTNWRFLLAFLVFSAVLITVLAILYQIVFWYAVS